MSKIPIVISALISFFADKNAMNRSANHNALRKLTKGKEANQKVSKAGGKRSGSGNSTSGAKLARLKPRALTDAENGKM